MNSQQVRPPVTLSADDRARMKSIRDWFQKERPTEAQVVAGGDWSIPVPHGVFLDLCEIAKQLKASREAAGLSRADAAARCGATEQGITAVEHCAFEPETVRVLSRYATVFRKHVSVVLTEIPVEKEANPDPVTTNGKHEPAP